MSTEKVESLYTPTYQDVVNSPLGKIQNQLDILSNTHSQLGTPNAFILPSAKTDIPNSIRSRDVDVKNEIKNWDIKHLDHVPRIKEIEVNFKRNVKHDSEEFARQLKD